MLTVIFLMYLADLTTGVAVVCGLVGLVMLVVFVVKWFVNATDDFGEGAWKRTMPKKRLLWIVVALWAVAAIMPSRTTLYMAAAIYAGDTFAQTERGQKVLNALDAWLDEQAAPDAK